MGWIIGAIIIAWIYYTSQGGFEMTKEECIADLKSINATGMECIDYAIKALEQQPSDDCAVREFIKIIVEYPPENLCTYPEYKGKPYFSIEYKENNEDIIGYGTYNSDVLSAWLKEYFIQKPGNTTQRWIPVSEGLPKEDGEYLLFGKIDEDEENYIFIGEYDSCGEQFGIWREQFDRTTLGCLGSECFEYSSVIAWQPLPKPYEEKRGDENG